MASLHEFRPSKMPLCPDALLPHAPDTSYPLSVGACEQFLFDISDSTQPQFFSPDCGALVAAREFVALPTGSVNGGSFANLAWSCPTDGMMQSSIPTQALSSIGIAEIAGLSPNRGHDSRRHSTMKHDCRSLSARDQSLRKQRVAKESLRRKMMSKWFSKLEVLLPQDDICKFDRCSVIDAAINYIRSLETMIAETSQISGCQKLEVIDQSSKQRRPLNSITDGQQVVSQAVVSVSTNSENAFVNAVSSQRDPTHFSSVLSMLREQQLEIVTANVSQTGQTVVYSAHAKIPNAVDFSSNLLQDRIYNCINSTPQRRETMSKLRSAQAFSDR